MNYIDLDSQFSISDLAIQYFTLLADTFENADTEGGTFSPWSDPGLRVARVIEGFSPQDCAKLILYITPLGEDDEYLRNCWVETRFEYGYGLEYLLEAMTVAILQKAGVIDSRNFKGLLPILAHLAKVNS